MLNYIDTSLPYHMGASETVLDQTIGNGYREKINWPQTSPWSVRKTDGLENIFKTQLKNLKTGYIDYYLLHGLNRTSWDKMLDLGALEFLTKLKQMERL